MAICLRFSLYSILNRRWNYFYYLLNAHTVNEARQTEILTTEPLLFEPSSFDTDIEKLRKYKWPSTDKIQAELIKVGGTILYFVIHKLINNSVWNKEEIPGRNVLLYVFIKIEINLAVVFSRNATVIIYIHFIQHPSLKANSIRRRNNWGLSV
jgi:hypothetical protein